MASRGKAGKQLRQAGACSRKVAYPTREAAEYARRGLIATTSDLAATNVYRCIACRQFHVGKTPSNRRPDR